LGPQYTANVDVDTQRVVARDPSGVGLAIVPLDVSGGGVEVIRGRGEESPVAGAIQGWTSFSSGIKEPSPVVRYRREDSLPVVFAAFLFPLPGEQAIVPHVQCVPVFGSADSGGEGVVGAQVHLPDGSKETILLGMLGSSAPRSLHRVGDLQTDALAASITVEGDSCLDVSVFAGTRVLWNDREVACLEPERSPGTFAFRRLGSILEVFTAEGSGKRTDARLLLRAGYPDRVLLDGREIPWKHEVGATVIDLRG
jgi:hypothetical protein